MILSNNLKVLIAAAGKGSRSGLNYPKTLYKIDGISILERIYNVTKEWDECPSIIVSKEGKPLIKDMLDSKLITSDLLVQKAPKGMGDAILQFKKSKFFLNTKHILLLWGDLPYITSDTLYKCYQYYFEKKLDFLMPSILVKDPYTKIVRGNKNKVLKVIETKDFLHDASMISSSEREIGVFFFRKDIVFNLLDQDLDRKFGISGEHGFLYIVEHLVKNNKNVEALPIAKKQELVSLNFLSDLS